MSKHHHHGLQLRCKDATRLTALLEEGKLTLRQRFGLWLHTRYCKGCRNFMKQWQALNAYLKQHHSSVSSTALDAQTRSRLESRFNELL